MHVAGVHAAGVHAASVDVASGQPARRGSVRGVVGRWLVGRFDLFEEGSVVLIGEEALLCARLAFNGMREGLFGGGHGRLECGDRG